MKKRYIAAIIIILCVVVFTGLTAANDYMWADRMIKEKMRHHWVAAGIDEPKASPLHPWTYITKPISQLVFVKINEMENIGDDLILVKTLWVNHEQLTRTRQKLSQKVVDCKAEKIAVIEPEISIKKINLSKLTWRDAKIDPLDSQIVEAVCAE